MKLRIAAVFPLIAAQLLGCGGGSAPTPDAVAEVETLPLLIHSPEGTEVIEIPLDPDDPPEERRLRGLIRAWGIRMQDNPNWCIGICGPDNQRPRCCPSDLLGGGWENICIGAACYDTGSALEEKP